MTLEREVHPDLRSLLLSGEPFEYAHLIKFERPSRPDSASGLTSTASVRYTHLTDASRDIGFDDESKDSNGVSNGSQTYRANKVLKVSEVSESIEAKASNFSITVDGNGLGAEIGAQPMTISTAGADLFDIAIPNSLVDPVAEGFREGDKIEFYGAQTGTFNIESFRANNVIRVSKIDTDLTVGSHVVGFRLSSEEIKSILLDKTLLEYASFINREVFIFKVFQKNGLTVGTPVLLFKGIISNVSFEDNESGIRVTWGLTSHWGDFAQVKGRISSDDFHRALDQNGNPQPLSALKQEYAYDKGFMHAETSINTLAKYSVQVEKQNIKVKKGFLGIGSKVKVKKYMVAEDRFTQLDLQLSARSIPLHYGVRVTEGFPIFADTLANDSSTVYVLYALGEGPIGAIYDVIIDGKSLICNNKGDFDTRSQQTTENTVDLVCRGRADRGDVLTGASSVNYTAPPQYYYGTGEDRYAASGDNFYGNILNRVHFQPYVRPTPEQTSAVASNGKGLIDGETLTLTSPIDMTLDFFSGKSGQAAASQLVEISKANGFKVQSSYWAGRDTAEYWGPNHRLLDTAYVLVKYKISEGETSLPTLEFVIKGKIVECFNYDYSYAHYDKITNEDPNNFALGSTVTLHRSDNDASIGTVQIIDKWKFVRGDGTEETRFRFSATPALGYVEGKPSITKFYMKNGSNQRWTMFTFNFVEHSGSIPSILQGDVTLSPPAGGEPGTIFPPPIPPLTNEAIVPPIFSLTSDTYDVMIAVNRDTDHYRSPLAYTDITYHMQ